MWSLPLQSPLLVPAPCPCNQVQDKHGNLSDSAPDPVEAGTTCWHFPKHVPWTQW